MCHEIKTTKMMALEYENEIMIQNIKLFKDKAKGIIKDRKNLSKLLKVTIKEKKSTLDRLGDKTLSIEEQHRKDISLVSEAVIYLENLKEEAFTDILRDAAQKAVETLNVNEGIDNEIEHMEEKIKTINSDIIRIKKEIKDLNAKGEKSWLKKVAMFENNEPSDEIELALVLCLSNNLFSSSPFEGGILKSEEDATKPAIGTGRPLFEFPSQQTPDKDTPGSTTSIELPFGRSPQISGFGGSLLTQGTTGFGFGFDGFRK
eukprot:gnl/Chilomastix_caulleri/1385.p1 GENE.gnl/Chilomastix_caulleri/1385~~gnl/Chilomastix_caulleri/1385.p1  ORF type:complete len:260 (+),score=50.44 gnl/Chilomastix_caulleri/1385:110-889(+)